VLVLTQHSWLRVLVLSAFGDEFMDIWVYVTLKANVNRLATTTAYVEALANEGLMTSEFGYYFTALRVANDYIKRLTPEKLNVPTRQSLIGKTILVAERTHYQNLCQGDARCFDLSNDKLVLAGYRMYAVVEWLQSLNRFYHVLIQPTGNPNDKVCYPLANQHRVRVRESVRE
jgi:hypothetical protein